MHQNLLKTATGIFVKQNDINEKMKNHNKKNPTPPLIIIIIMSTVDSYYFEFYHTYDILDTFCSRHRIRLLVST